MCGQPLPLTPSVPANTFGRLEKSQSEERFRVSWVIGVRQLARQCFSWFGLYMLAPPADRHSIPMSSSALKAIASSSMNAG